MDISIRIRPPDAGVALFATKVEMARLCTVFEYENITVRGDVVFKHLKYPCPQVCEIYTFNRLLAQ